jgi:hypothetical protein
MDLISAEPAIAGDAICADLLQRVPQVRIPVGIINCGGEKELRHPGS